MGEHRLPLVAAASTVALGMLALDAWAGGPLDRFERRVIRPPRAGPGHWALFTRLGGRPALVMMSTCAFGVALLRRGDVAGVLVPVAVGVPLRVVLMRGVDRTRPPRERWLVEATGASFPSRHTTAAALGLLALRSALPASRALDLACAGLVAAEGYSRVRLGVHWPSDVAGGLLLALTVSGLGGRRSPKDR